MAAAIVKDGRSKIFFAGTGVMIPKEFIFSLNKVMTSFTFIAFFDLNNPKLLIF